MRGLLAPLLLLSTASSVLAQDYPQRFWHANQHLPSSSSASVSGSTSSGGSASASVEADPKLTSPSKGQVVKAGDEVEVSWDKGASGKGTLLLGYRKKSLNEHLNVGNPLASGLDLGAGSKKVKLPGDLPTRDDYILVLMGDSGNSGPKFTIQSSGGGSSSSSSSASTTGSSHAAFFDTSRTAAADDVEDPAITTPSATTVWTAGETVEVEWDTADLPSGYDGKGTILIGHRRRGTTNEHLDVEHPLASGFELSAGKMSVQLPADLPARKDYILVLMGDSGNSSPAFEIQAGNSTNSTSGAGTASTGSSHAAFFSSGSQGASAVGNQDMVQNPKITAPKQGDKWTAGQQGKVTWNSAPFSGTSAKGTLYLGYRKAGTENEHLNIKSPLADGFQLNSGEVVFTVPSSLPARDDYIVVLMGDSGNSSPSFSIAAKSGGSSASASTAASATGSESSHAEFFATSKASVEDLKITNPKAGDTWTAGKQVTVKWNTGSLPSNPADYNDNGQILIGWQKDGKANEHLNIKNPLANVHLAVGQISFTVPKDLPERDDYILVLMGDSGNASPKFTIKGSGSSSSSSGSSSASHGASVTGSDQAAFFAQSNSAASVGNVDMVENPKITSPTAKTSWKAGEKGTVTWSTGGKSASGKGTLLLGWRKKGGNNEHLNINDPLAKNFDLSKGSIDFTIPADLPERKDYIIVLMGDSGNASPQFHIAAGSGGKSSGSSASASETGSSHAEFFDPQRAEVVDPKITNPTKGEIWTAGKTYTVTWDNAGISQGTKGQILIGYQKAGTLNEHLNVNHPLASNIDLSTGKHSVALPKTLPTRKDYILVLMGDSGNSSPRFTIKAAGSSGSSSSSAKTTAHADFFASSSASTTGAGNVDMVQNPKITAPKQGDKWTAGQKSKVTWDSSPFSGTSATGTLYLGWRKAGTENEHLNIKEPLADDFQLNSGEVDFTVPSDLPARDDYIVVLMGDSGNSSPSFSIATSSSGSSSASTKSSTHAAFFASHSAEVEDPPITSPTKDTKWTAGQQVTVKWNTGKLPSNPADFNDNGQLLLGWQKDGKANEHLNLKNPLANVHLAVGQISFNLPHDLPARDDYIVVLMGDSGNASPPFSVAAAASGSTSSADAHAAFFSGGTASSTQQAGITLNSDLGTGSEKMVENPTITSPTGSTVWTAGQQATVTWDASPFTSSPATGTVILGYEDSASGGEHLDIENPLADTFPLSAGTISFTVPASTQERSTYIIVLMGDSGNASAKFTIKGSGSGSATSGSSSSSQTAATTIATGATSVSSGAAATSSMGTASATDAGKMAVTTNAPSGASACAPSHLLALAGVVLGAVTLF